MDARVRERIREDDIKINMGLMDEIKQMISVFISYVFINSIREAVFKPKS